MRRCVIMAAALAVCVPAFAEPAPDQPETVTIRDLMGGGTREVSPDWDTINTHKLGTEGNPVRCDMPRGEQLYLSRLRCPGGESPTFNREGSNGRSPYGTIMDIYTVTCPETDGMEPQTVYMDMYHPNYQEKRAVPGFTIVPPVESVHPTAD